MQPGFIQIGETYYATIRAGGREDILTDSEGAKLPFTSAARAVSEARRRIQPPPAALPEPIDETPDIVREWNKNRLAEKEKLRDMGTLLNIEVVRKKRRGNVTEATTRRIDYRDALGTPQGQNGFHQTQEDSGRRAQEAE